MPESVRSFFLVVGHLFCLLGMLSQTQVLAEVTPRFDVVETGWAREPYLLDLHNDVVRHPEDGALYGISKLGGALGHGMIFRLSAAGQMQTLVQFTGVDGPCLGAEPSGALIIGTDGSLFGMTTKGGRNNRGTLFKITRQGEFTTLVDFGMSYWGDQPLGGLILGPEGHLYGITQRGGFPSTSGTFFRLTQGGALTSLTNTDFYLGQTGHGRLVIGPDGYFYGMTSEGGDFGAGRIYRISSAGAVTSVVHFNVSNGAYPRGGLTVGSDGLLYGMTPAGGNFDSGVLFSLTTAGQFTPLVHFKPGTPNGSLTLGADGLLYGMTESGGSSGMGRVFRLSATNTLDTLVNFTGVDGASKGSVPRGSLTLSSDGYFYGVTMAGGVFNRGTIFRMSVSGELTTLYEMRPDGITGSGGVPLSGLVYANDGHFYGMTNKGGSLGHGTLFRMSTAGARSTLLDFPEMAAAGVQGRLIQGFDSDFYGMARGGGDQAVGSIFRMTPAGVLTTLMSFQSPYTGPIPPMIPFGGLVEGALGEFYGATAYGGAADMGGLFKINSAGTFTHLLDFTGNGGANKGGRMAGDLTQGFFDGHFYGVTQAGGTFGKGTAFRMTAAGVLTTLVEFTGNGATNKGQSPVGTLVEGTDGHFYGMTRLGGAQNFGTIFKMTSAGVLTTLVEFTNKGAPNKGAEPEGSLFQAADDNFYGMTNKGGASDRGTVFRMTPAGVLTTLVEFTGSGSGVSSGAFPMYSQFAADESGNLWGTTSAGGPGGAGMVFKLSLFYKAISIRGRGFEITPGSASTSTLNDTDFGGVPVPETSISHIFYIVNTGSNWLHLIGNPKVKISGAAASDFQVLTLPSGTVEDESYTTFEIAFNPSAEGVRDALVSVTNDDPLRSGYSFAISGVGLPPRSAQTITFAEPAQVYQAEGPITLTATASSGLEVVYSVLSGPGSVTGNQLTLTGPGTVQIQASQSGDQSYFEAPAVTRSLNVIANPPVPALLDLRQVYTGSPRAVRAVATAPTTVQYKAGGVWTAMPPVAAGSYAVTASTAQGAKKTGTLVVAKALLTVTPHAQRKFAGQPNPALGFEYSGFVGGETAATAVSKAPVISTTATASSTGGFYPVKSSGGSSANYMFVYQTSMMQVETFAGGYEALLFDEVPAAKLELTVAASSKTFTGKLRTFHSATVVSLRGNLTLQAAMETALGTATVKVGSNTYVVNFILPLTGIFSASATRDGQALGAAADGRKLLVVAKGQAIAYTGAHTVILAPAQPAGDDVPAGSGWASASMDAKGIMKLVGKLGDGTGFTTSLAADDQSDPGYRLFLQPYLPARTGSYMAGRFTLKPHASITNRRQVPASDAISLTWIKGRRDADKSYREGFGPVTTQLSLDPWLPPVAGTKTLAAIPLAARLKLTRPVNEITVSHGDTGSASQSNLPARLFMHGTTGAVTVAAPATTSPNLTKWKITSTASTGAFAGSFELVDAGKKRTVKMDGVLRQPESGAAGLVIGAGHFLVPALPGVVNPQAAAGNLVLTLP